MGVLDSLREFLDIRRDSRSYCKSCETLKEQLTIANHEKKMLMQQLFKEPVPVTKEPERLPEPIAPKVIPWALKRQMLIAEDREAAASLRRAKEEEELAKKRAADTSSKTSGPIENSSISIDQLEKELAIGGDE